MTPRFIPFADMTTDHSPYFGMPHAVAPHTHDKPARTRTEENT